MGTLVVALGAGRCPRKVGNLMPITANVSALGEFPNIPIKKLIYTIGLLRTGHHGPLAWYDGILLRWYHIIVTARSIIIVRRDLPGKC